MAFVKSSGSKGLHVHVPLDRRTGFDQVRDFAHEIAGLLAARTPDRYTVEQRKDSAVTQVFVDVLRTAHAQTAVAPYAVRARPGRQRGEGEDGRQGGGPRMERPGHLMATKSQTNQTYNSRSRGGGRI